MCRVRHMDQLRRCKDELMLQELGGRAGLDTWRECYGTLSSFEHAGPDITSSMLCIVAMTAQRCNCTVVQKYRETQHQ